MTAPLPPEATLHSLGHQKVKCNRIRRGRNPRTYFDPAEMAELKEGIRAVGYLIHPITVRPVPIDANGTDLELVAGERRWTNFCELFGPNSELDANVLILSDEEADLIALIENVHSAKMSPTEEAEAAHKLLMRYQDRDEVALATGWPRSMVDRRLALMQCIPEVRSALTERKIKLGHAELLAILDAEKQPAVLARVLEKDWSVGVLKNNLMSITQKLSVAIFDKADCTNCRHNSSLQAALFAENIGDGSCSHPSCYQQKTIGRLAEIKAELEQEVQRVEYLEPGEGKTIPIKLVSSGARAVGEVQMNACRSCANYGATVSAQPASMGVIEREICFDSQCHTLKQGEYLKEMKSKIDSQKGVSSQTGGSGTKRSADKGGTSAPRVAKASSTRQAIKDHVEKTWRRIAFMLTTANSATSANFLTWLTLTGNIRHFDSNRFRETYTKLTQQKFSSTEEPSAGMAMFGEISPEVFNKLRDVMAGYALHQLEIRHVRNLLSYLQADLTQLWKVDKAFLELLTVAEIEAYCNEVGLGDVITQEALKKLLTGKKSAIVEALLTFSGTHLAGKVPAFFDFTKK
ncbi:PRTRC system ParB family protein [Chromobacterium haemolyticum]|uniref:PRTRC system ParB family protein n=1 Tax=Chromobacterium fluminis TaxID=3044269 RepID=A0ABX0KY94_9NEIS|nr:PRTRC system ParB family protein [Chromobacterium haemolyticum]NHR04465.1 PRTRC system ParB family protein [Chromobacterium haemolyticum]